MSKNSINNIIIS